MSLDRIIIKIISDTQLIKQWLYCKLITVYLNVKSKIFIEKSSVNEMEGTFSFPVDLRMDITYS